MKCITFASHDKYIDAGKRLIQQSTTLNLFTESILYTPEYLKTTEFWEMHKDFVNKRGYGYWLWKSFIIKKTMENMKDGDILLYLDCGCELDNNKKNELLNSINIVKQDKIMATPTRCENDREWTKMDLIEKLDMNNESLDTRQRQAGAILFLVCNETRELVNEWYNIGCNYHNIDDSPSILTNFPNFVEHRHDQSIFSLLTKKYNMYSNTNLKGMYYIRNTTGNTEIYNYHRVMQFDYTNH
jgi:hypothetical protein